MAATILVDPGELHLPPSRLDGADPAKLMRQLSKHGNSIQGIPPLLLYQGTDGAYMIYDGVTRATRVAKLLPGTQIPAEVMATTRVAVSRFPKVKDKLP